MTEKEIERQNVQLHSDINIIPFRQRTSVRLADVEETTAVTPVTHCPPHQPRQLSVEAERAKFI